MANGSQMECGLCGIGRGHYLTPIEDDGGRKTYKFLCESCVTKLGITYAK